MSFIAEKLYFGFTRNPGIDIKDYSVVIIDWRQNNEGRGSSNRPAAFTVSADKLETKSNKTPQCCVCVWFEISDTKSFNHHFYLPHPFYTHAHTHQLLQAQAILRPFNAVLPKVYKLVILRFFFFPSDFKFPIQLLHAFIVKVQLSPPECRYTCKILT